MKGLTKLFDSKGRTMNVAGLMSITGSNLRKIIELERAQNKEGVSPFHVSVIFTDDYRSNAVQIGREYNIPVIVNDIRTFYNAQGKPRSDMQTRAKFDERTVEMLGDYGVCVAAYAGYMSIASPILVNAFLGINVHPATSENGKIKYRGGNGVRDAILAGEKEIRATTHIVSEIVDDGRILMTSAPSPVILGENWDPSNPEIVKAVADENQDRLKKIGDHVIFPRTLLYLSQGRFAKDEQGNLYFDCNQIPNGVRLET